MDVVEDQVNCVIGDDADDINIRKLILATKRDAATFPSRVDLLVRFERSA